MQKLQFDINEETIELVSVKADMYIKIKRLIDMILSSFILLIVWPIILFFAILIRIETPGSPFFLQERVGYKGKNFNIIKLRSMYIFAEENGAQWATKNDPRVTKIGRFIRNTRIDELPQLFNVIRGDMSLIGPRPERPVFTQLFSKDIEGFEQRLEVKPGITGWAQVNGGYDISPKEKFELDKYYIQNLGLSLDIKIVFRTIFICITGKGAR